MSHPVTEISQPLIAPAPSQALPPIFAYEDYREFLKDVLKLRQKTIKGYTLAHFAKTLGFSSHSGLAMVLTGKRELRPPYIDHCISHLKLSIRQQLYFEAMIQADRLSSSKRKSLLEEIETRATEWETPEATDGVRLLDFFLTQQILSLYRGSVSLEKIQSHFRYAIEKRNLTRVLKYMVEKGVADRTPEGYRINRSVLMIADEIPNVSARQFHKDCMHLAASSLDSDAIDKREFQTYVVTVDSARIPEMKKHLKKLVMEAISDFESELDGDTVVQMHFNLFEMTHRVQTTDRASRLFSPDRGPEGNA